VPTIALVNPQLVSSGFGRGARPQTMDDALPRHSLLYLSSPLKEAGHEVVLVDLRLLAGWADYERLIEKRAPDFVCVTAHTVEAEAALECCRRAKKVLPKCTTVAGGIHFTMFPDLGEGEGIVDFVIRGEAELSLPELVTNPAAFPRVSWGEPPELDALPFEDRELYPDYADRIGFSIWDLPTPLVDMITGRGCPWQCRFCCGPGEQNLFTAASRQDPGARRPLIRRRSVVNVMDEMEVLYDRYRFRSVVFHDDQFVIQPGWVEEFCAALHRRGFVERDIQWWAASRSDVICRHPELIETMRDAGLEVISIGFESFSDRMLEWMRKETTREENLRAAEICHGLGLTIFANVIFGMPYRDGVWYPDDDEASLEAIRTIRPKHFSPSFFDPIPGSWLFEWAVERGLLITGEPVATGDRRPGQAKLKGVDYGWLADQLDACRRECGPTVASRLSLRHRLRRFASKPLPEKIGTVRARLSRLVSRG
jgi:anaerobic magnesium-protoporphyrin IX monomethyl ester cyclase